MTSTHAGTVCTAHSSIFRQERCLSWQNGYQTRSIQSSNVDLLIQAFSWTVYLAEVENRSLLPSCRCISLFSRPLNILKGGSLPSMEAARRTVHHDALPKDKTLTVRAPRLLMVAVATASNRMLISSMLTTDPVGIPTDDMEEFTRQMKSSWIDSSVSWTWATRVVRRLKFSDLSHLEIL